MFVKFYSLNLFC